MSIPNVGEESPNNKTEGLGCQVSALPYADTREVRCLMNHISDCITTARTQPELRKDTIMGRWVIIATERANRPLQITETPRAARLDACPFCGGNEAETPLEVAAWRDGTLPNTQGWQVRVVPNKFPALRGEGD